MRKQICPECNGEGVLWSYESGDKYAEREPYDCDECDGSGFVTDSGTGRVTNLPTEPDDLDSNPARGIGIADDKPHAPLLEKHDSQLEPFEEWYAKTKAHGGTREEYDKLKTAVAPNPIPDELMAILHRLEDYRRKDESKWENSLTAPEAHAAITRLYAGREAAARVDELETIYSWRVNGKVNSVPHARSVVRADAIADRLASLREGGANGA